MTARVLGLLSLLVAIALAASGCGRKGDPASGTAAENAEAPVPAPRGVLAEVVVATPSTSWPKLQRGVGGPLGLLPATFAGALFSTLGVDPTLAAEVDAVAPVHGVVASETGPIAWAVALRLSDARHARAVWLTGEAPPLVARPRGPLVELTPRARTDNDVALGLTPGGFLVVASNGAALEALGPYAARTLTTRKIPPHAVVIDVPEGAFANGVAPRLENAWTSMRRDLLERDERLRADHGGREPDFGDPKAIVAAVDGAVTPRLALARDVARATVTLDVGDEDATLEARLVPRDATTALAARVAAMRLLPPDAVAGLPARALAALAHRVQDDEPDAGAAPLPLALLDVAGARLDEAHRKRLRVLADDAAAARIETVAFAGSATEPRATFVHVQAGDPVAATRALDAAIELAGASPFKDALHVEKTATKTEDVEGLGKVSLATFTRSAAPAPRRGAADAGAPADVVRIASAPVEGGLLLGAGDDAVGALRWGRKPERTLGAEPTVTRLLRGARDASTVLVLQPLLVDPSRAPAEAAPFTLVVGRADGGPRLEAAVTFALLHEASRYLLGF